MNMVAFCGPTKAEIHASVCMCPQRIRFDRMNTIWFDPDTNAEAVAEIEAAGYDEVKVASCLVANQADQDAA